MYGINALRTIVNGGISRLVIKNITSTVRGHVAFFTRRTLDNVRIKICSVPAKIIWASSLVAIAIETLLIFLSFSTLTNLFHHYVESTEKIESVKLF